MFVCRLSMSLVVSSVISEITSLNNLAALHLCIIFSILHSFSVAQYNLINNDNNQELLESPCGGVSTRPPASHTPNVGGVHYSPGHHPQSSPSKPHSFRIHNGHAQRHNHPVRLPLHYLEQLLSNNKLLLEQVLCLNIMFFIQLLPLFS